MRMPPRTSTVFANMSCWMTTQSMHILYTYKSFPCAPIKLSSQLEEETRSCDSASAALGASARSQLPAQTV